ncbi:hypothetical protein HN011_011341 [Eciton burchellii]|nr:hypothetical protein HN011_011341 [Eciton burchellii]
MAELRKRILPTRPTAPLKNHENVDRNIAELSERLAKETRELQRSRTEIKNVENVLSDVGNKTLSCRDRYRSIMIALKKDVRKTEIEMKTLQDHASKLSLRREELKNEILKQGQDYQKMIDNFTKNFGTNDLENIKCNDPNSPHTLSNRCEASASK